MAINISNGPGAATSADEIEVTPEMVEAGASVLYRMELAFAGEEFWAKEVYRAMAARAPATRSPICEESWPIAR